MRRRLVTALIGMTFAVIVLYAVPRALYVADYVRQQEQREVKVVLDHLVEHITGRERQWYVTEATLAGWVEEGDGIEYVGEGRRVSVGVPASAGADGGIVRSRRSPAGGRLTIVRSAEVVDARVADALRPIVLIGAALLIASAAVGFLLARRLSRPFQELAGVAGDLGSGRFDVEVPHYRVPEAEDIATALRTGARRLESLVRREREFAVNASHQLRTPITSLRLELEDLALWPQTPPEVARELEEALAELDRLGEAVTQLLHLARGNPLGATEPLDLAQVTAAAVQRWRPRAVVRGRRIEHVGDGPVHALLMPGPVAQILDVLIENALDHGAGDITVEVSDARSHLRVGVADQGTVDLDGAVFGRGVSGPHSDGHGVGLSVASELAESMDGYLSLEEGASTRFVLVLPRPVEDS